MRRINRFPMTWNIVRPKSIFIRIFENQLEPARLREKMHSPRPSLHFLIKNAAVNNVPIAQYTVCTSGNLRSGSPQGRLIRRVQNRSFRAEAPSSSLDTPPRSVLVTDSSTKQCQQ